MALSFPIALPDVPLNCTYFGFSIPGQRAQVRSGSTPGTDTGSALFRADYETTVLRGFDFRLMTAWLDAVKPVEASVLAWDTRSRYPFAYQKIGWNGLVRAAGGAAFDGTCTLASIGIDGHTIGLSGLPTGFKLGPGDPLSFIYDASRYAYHRGGPVAPAVAGSDGMLSLWVEPLISPLASTGGSVKLEKPTFFGNLVPDSVKDARDSFGSGTFSFSILQSLDKSA